MHTFTKRVTFTPLKNGRYRCNQTNEVLSRGQILSAVSAFLSGNHHAVIGRRDRDPFAPKKAKKSASNRPSKYRAKRR